MALRNYAGKRRFSATPEPSGDDRARVRRAPFRRPIFVVQLHQARARHFDFRLEADGVLKSWAVPKGPSLRPGEKRLAVEVEDHPLAYATFAGDIPAGNYGAGHVDLFDHGHWSCEGDPLQAIAAGKVDFVLHGRKLRGGWKLIRTRARGTQVQWLLIKRQDEFAADAEADDLVAQATSKARPARPRSSAKGRKPALEHRDWAAAAAAIPGARRKPFPAGFKPQLTSLRTAVPRGDDWLHEVKWDGYRLLTDLERGRARLRSRNDLDWTGDFPELARALEALPVASARLDGELVALDAQGRSDFNALQKTLEGRGPTPLRYVLFDVPGLAGVDLSASPLIERKRLLEELLAADGSDRLIFSQHVIGRGKEVFSASASQGLEGIISKRIAAPYEQSRSSSWVKIKHEHTDEFVVVGYTAPEGQRRGFGSFLMATPANGSLRYVGRVGTGFDDAVLKSIYQRLRLLEQATATVALPAHVPFSPRHVHWVRPELVAEVAFRGWAKEGLLRQASFKRLRDDKTPREIGMAAVPLHPDFQVHITHPERIIYAEGRITKGEVADYYRAVARWLLPELAYRPLSLLRCPDGAAGSCFFQKHHADSLGDSVNPIALKQKSGLEDYLFVADIEGVLELVQMNTLEFHPWGSRIEDPEHPDRLVFDLDPDESIAWKMVVAAAREVRARLREARLESFVRLSGGKGLHVVVPIVPGPARTGTRCAISARPSPMRWPGNNRNATSRP